MSGTDTGGQGVAAVVVAFSEHKSKTEAEIASNITGAKSVELLSINEVLQDTTVAESKVGQTLRLRFTVPGNVIESEAIGAVVWVNPRQGHPVHSLPPGFGIRFLAPQLDREVLRLDFGFPLTRHEEGEFTINATFGQAFLVP